nr:hypothetical protein [Tanacetum cinerariifolium]
AGEGEGVFCTCKTGSVGPLWVFASTPPAFVPRVSFSISCKSTMPFLEIFTLGRLRYGSYGWRQMLRGVTLMVSEQGYETVGSKDLTCEDWMVNTRTAANLSVAVQNALQTLLPQIRTDIREEFRTSSGPSDAGENPPPVNIHTWLERFNKQKPYSFEKDAFKTRLAMYKFEGNALAWWKAYKQAKGGDAWLITVTWVDLKKLFFLQFFPRAEQERLKREYHSIRQTNTETSTEFMKRFLRLAGFLGAAAGTEEEQAKNFQWGLRRSTLNHLMCMSYTDMVNTRTDADLSAAVQNALQTLLSQIHAEIREEFRTSSGPSDSGGNPPLVTIHTWLERFNKQKPRSFEKATVPVDAENWISHMKKIFDVMGCEDAFKTRLAVYKFEAAGTAEEQAKNFQWCLRMSTLNHLMCIPFTDVAQVANAARNYEILHERDDDDADRPDKR